MYSPALCTTLEGVAPVKEELQIRNSLHHRCPWHFRANGLKFGGSCRESSKAKYNASFSS